MRVDDYKMSSKIVQVKPNVHDPDFSDLNLGGSKLKYIESHGGGSVLFKIMHPTATHIARCKTSELNPNYISLNRTEVFWHKKDWVSPGRTHSGLSCYGAVKRGRRCKKH